MPRLGSSIAAIVLAALACAPAAWAAPEEVAHSGAPATPPAVFSPTELIVQWAGGADHGEKVEAREEAEVEFNSDLGNRRFQLVEVETGQSAHAALTALNADPAVEVAERNSYSAPNSIPDDPLFGEQWALQNLGSGIDGFSGAVAGDDINATSAWNRTVGIPSVVVADIDSGYRFEHPDLANVAWTNPGEIPGNGIDDDGDGIIDDVHGADFVGPNGESPTVDGDPTDEDLVSGGHGVHTAGIIGAEGNNGVGISGVAQNVRIMPLRVCSHFPSLNELRCPVSSQIAAINYAAEKGARAANMSLGSNFPSTAERNAIAEHPNLLIVTSAGNDAGDNDAPEAAPKGPTTPATTSPMSNPTRPSPARSTTSSASPPPTKRTNWRASRTGGGLGGPRRPWDPDPQHLPGTAADRRPVRAGRLRFEMDRQRCQRRLRPDQRGAAHLVRHQRLSSGRPGRQYDARIDFGAGDDRPRLQALHPVAEPHGLARKHRRLPLRSAR